MGTAAFSNEEHERLLRALTEQLKLPLIQIAREAELASETCDVASFNSISHTADTALRLVDSYLLSIQLQALPVMEVEPVSVSAVLQDTAHQLDALAKQYNCELQVDIKGSHQPVMAHRSSLEAAYATLGHAFIETATDTDEKHRVVLGVHQAGKGLVTGVFGTQQVITTDALRRGAALFGTARQALPGMSATSGAGIFIANSLLANLDAPLHTSRHNKLSGLAATLLPSHQLVLV